MRVLFLMETLLRDLSFEFRRLLKSPGFTLVAFVSLALGIGANTAIFSLVNTVLLRPLPVAAPEEIYTLSVKGPQDSILAFSYPNYVDFRDRNEVLSGLFVTRFAPMSLSRDGSNERVWGYLVSGNYFDVLGVRAFRGRTFSPEEDRTRLSHPVAVISHGCWQRRFGADPELVGKDVIINGHTFNIIGIMPEGFIGTELIYTPEVWVPMMMQGWIEPGNPWLDRRSTQNIFATGRLKPGVTVGQAEASLNLLAEQLGREYPETNEGQMIELTPPGFIIPSLRGAVVSFTLVLMAAVTLVLFIACTNLASLLLVRATERRKEIAIRLSLGASRLRLARQFFTESLLLSITGGALGVMLAAWIINLAVAFRPPIDFPLHFVLNMDWRVFVFSMVVTLVTGLVFGLAPALQATNPDLVTALKDTAAQAGYRRSRLRGGLIVAQIALSLVLLIAAGLVVRALQQLQTMSPGFDTQNALMMSVDLGLQGYDRARGQQFYTQLVERVRALPGVRAASTADFVPLSLNYNSNTIYVEGQASARGANVPTAMVSSVGPDYFEAMGVPLLNGRAFTEQDNESAQRVAIVNETFARRLLPGPNPVDDAVGKRVSFRSAEGPFMQIVGVAKDGKYFNIGEDPRPFIYSPVQQDYSSNGTLIVRTSSDPEAMIAAIRAAVQELDRNLPLYDVKTMTEHMSLSLFPARMAAIVLGGFGLLALALAAIGIYGVTAYSVAQRTREIGIRMALGARSQDVLRLVLKQGMILVTLGLAIGLAASFILTRLMSSLLYGVSATDFFTFVIISAALIGVALAACFIPARRATRVDPMSALRSE